MITDLLMSIMPQANPLVQQLKDPSLVADAAASLIEADPSSFITDLGVALSTDPDFQSGTNARFHAYNVLSGARSIEMVEDKEIRRISHPEQLALLIIGLTDSDYHVREQAVFSLPHWVSARRAQAIQRLRLALQDSSARVRIAACRSAAEFGSEAIDCLNILQSLLDGSSGSGIQGYWTQLPTPDFDPVDLEIPGRSEAAFARQRIAHFTVDRELYDILDAAGKDALCVAWMQYIFYAVGEQDALDPSHQRRCASFSSVAGNSDCILRILDADRLSRLPDRVTHDFFSAAAQLHDAGIMAPDVRTNLELLLVALEGDSALSEPERRKAAELRSLLGSSR